MPLFRKPLRLQGRFREPLNCRRAGVCWRDVQWKLGCMAVQTASMCGSLDVVKHFRSVSGSFSRVVPNRTSHDEGRLHMPHRRVISWWCWLDPGVCSSCCPLANRWQCGFSGRRPQGHGHNWERIGPSGQTHVSLRSSVYHRLRSLRDRDDGVGRRRRDRRLKQWLRHERLSVQMALAKFKRHSSQRARLARENSARRTQLHVAETTSPGERPESRRNRARLVDPWSRAYWLAFLLQCPRVAHEEKNVEQVRKRKEGLEKQEKAGMVRQPPRRFVESQHRRFALFFPSAERAARHFGRVMRLRSSTTPQKLGPFNSAFLSALHVAAIDTLMRDVDVDIDCPCSSSWQRFEVFLEVHCSEHFGPEVV